MSGSAAAPGPFTHVGDTSDAGMRSWHAAAKKTAAMHCRSCLVTCQRSLDTVALRLFSQHHDFVFARVLRWSSPWLTL
jgi:hypothetical protein